MHATGRPDKYRRNVTSQRTTAEWVCFSHADCQGNMMTNSEEDLNACGQQLDAIIAQYYYLEEKGETPDHEQFIARYPEHQQALSEFFADLDMFENSKHLDRNELAPEPSNTGNMLWEKSTARLDVRYFGVYEILQELGSGGMGVVYKARHARLRKHVALKLIRAGEFATECEVKMFLAEARAAAKLDHPGIVAVHEVGMHAGRHFYSMDYVAGGSLSNLHRDEPVAARRAADLVKQMAEAIHYAHEKGIVHRDLKPANILLTTGGVPRITDFGLAKRLWADQDSMEAACTVTGQVLGTAGYMSPEQATGKSRLVGETSDTYSLGAVLYALLTSRAPFVGESQVDTIQQVIETEPIAPRLLNPSIPRDLETICLKCLSKERLERYSTAQLLADDLQRFLDGRPVLARPISHSARAWRLCKRYPVVTGLSATVALSLLFGILISLFFANEARRGAEENRLLASKEFQAREVAERNQSRAETNARLARKHLYSAQMSLAQSEWNAGRVGAVQNLLNQYTPVSGEEDFRGFEWYYWKRCCESELRCFNGHTSFVSSVAYNPNGTAIVSAAHDGTVMVWSASTGEPLQTLVGHSDAVKCAVFSPDSALVASGSWDGTVRLWDATSGKQIRLPLQHSGKVESVAFSPNGSTLAAAARDGMIYIWNVISGELVAEMGIPQSFACSLAYSSDGSRLVSTHSNVAKIWDVNTGLATHTLTGHEGQVMRVAISPDQRTIATAGYDGTLKLWNASTGDGTLTLTGHEGAVNWVCFSPDSLKLASASSDRTIKIWNINSRDEVLTLNGHASYVAGVAFSPDGNQIVSAGWDHKVRLWDPNRRQEFTTLGETGFITRSVRFSPDTKTLVAGSDDGTIRRWSVEKRAKADSVKGHDGAVTCIEISPDGKWIASAGVDGAVKLRSGENFIDDRTFQGHTGSIRCVRFSPDGAWLVSASTDQTLVIWDVHSGKLLRTLSGHTGGVRSAAFSEDGLRIASAAADHTIRIWEAATGRTLQILEGHTQSVESIAFARDGTRLASGSSDQTVRMWDLTKSQELLKLVGHAAGIHAVALSPDDKRIASASGDGTLKLWDSNTGGEMLTLKGQSRHLYDVHFSSNGMFIASSNYDGSIQVWDASLNSGNTVHED